jgi:hypothetical protein
MVRLPRPLVVLGAVGFATVSVRLSNPKEIDMSGHHHVASRPLPYTYAFRIAVSIDANRATVTGVHRVAMRVPASAAGAPAEGQSGLWVELRGADGRVLYHRALRMAHPDSVEVFDDEKTGAIRRVPSARSRVVKFDLLVPDLPDAAELILHGPRDLSEPHRPGVALLQSPLHDLRRQAAPQIP